MQKEIIYDADGTWYMMPVFWHHLRAALLRIIRISAMHLKSVCVLWCGSFTIWLEGEWAGKSATVTAKTVMDATSAGGSHDRFATKALLTMITSDGETIRVAVSGNLPETVFDYQFDYQKLSI